MSDLVALDMMDDPRETWPWLQKLVSQIMQPAERLVEVMKSPMEGITSRITSLSLRHVA